MEKIEEDFKAQLLFYFQYNDSLYLTTSQKEKIINFLYKYKADYPSQNLDFLLNALDTEITGQEPAIARQVLDATGLYNKDKNPYLNYLQIFEKYFSYDQNIIDIGAGFYPASSMHLKEKQTKGTLTVYEPKLLTLERQDIIFKKEHFTIHTNIKEADLLFGIMPCESTETIIKKANQEHKNLFIGLCGCNHSENYDINPFFDTAVCWQQEMYTLLTRTNNDDCKIEMIDKNMDKNINFPVLIKKLN